jgi:predicted deacetylase
VRRPGTIAVSLHDVEPATFERCALIRDWLGDLGVDRATLLVIPAPDLHPFHDRRPDLAEWLEECRRGGDAIAQHGFQHRQSRRAGAPRQLVARVQGGQASEFVGLNVEETRRAVLAGRRLLKLAGISPRGFVAPGYAYTSALRATLASTFEWWAGLGSLYRADRETTHAPALTLGTSTAFKRWTSPGVVRLGARLSGDLLRLDLHPADLDHPRCVAAVERVLRGAKDRCAVTYDELAAASTMSQIALPAPTTPSRTRVV